MLQSQVCMTQNKTNQQSKTKQQALQSRLGVWGFSRKKATWGGLRRVRRAQLEDLLIALADRRSFPETRFFVARGIVGDTWSTESAAPVAFPASVLVLLVKEPGRGWGDKDRDRHVVLRQKQTWHRHELRGCRLSQHALSCMWPLPQQRSLSSSDFHQHSLKVQCKL